jgi:2-oxoglutarate dehydrogenase E2 component (dihydrolipoamide succinyltransferase)
MAKVDVTMPKMGESITEGTVLTWHKQVGDPVALDEVLLEIGTDKVDTEVPSPAAGVVAQLLVSEGTTVDVGTVIAVLETDVNAVLAPAPAVAPPAPAKAEAPSPAPLPTPPAPSVPSAPPPPAVTGGSDVAVVMPKMGESITEGTVLAWRKQAGDPIDLDEPLLEIGTDKVDTEVPSPAKGIVKALLVPAGETVEVGTPIALIAVGEGAVAEMPTPAAPPAAVTPPAATPPITPAATPAATGDGTPPVAQAAGPLPRKGDDGRFFSPLVRSIAEKEGVSLQELSALTGTGRDGRITKGDLLAYLATRTQPPAMAPTPVPVPTMPPPSAPAPARPTVAPLAVPTASEGGRVEIIEMDRMRQIIAEHMTRSKATSAHVTSFQEVDVTNLVRLRERNKAAFEKREGIKLTYTPFFVWAAVEALREHPLLNASVEGKQIILRKDFHVGIAVAVGKTGLMAPVIRDAGQKNLIGLAHAASDLAERTRNKQLGPNELMGGTFTVTNIGSLGSIMGTPIINQPQVAILATGAIKKRPVVVEDPTLGDVIAIRHMMYLSLSYDHRIIDGAMAASYLHRFVEVIETLDPGLEL